MATARDDNIDAQPSEVDSAAIMSCEADEFLQPPIEGAAAQLAERLVAKAAAEQERENEDA